MPSVRFLLLGTGFFARKWLETLKAHPDCTLAGVISRTPERAAEDNLKSFAIVCAALESSRTGRPVAISPLLASFSL